jgi:Rad3-related DNA helicase
MNYVRVGALTPPDEGRVAWVRANLIKAKEAGLTPKVVPIQEVVSFTAGLPPHIEGWLSELAGAAGVSPAQASAGLLLALESLSEVVGAVNEADPVIQGDGWIGQINPELHPLAIAVDSALSAGRVAFAEASTGTGKGRMILALALKAIDEGRQVVVSAPLTLAWQLTAELQAHFAERVPSVAVILGRANFVCPEALLDWAMDQDVPPQDLVDWIAGGGKPSTPQAINQSALLGVELAWLAEEAYLRAENVPGDVLLHGNLSEDEAHDCPAEKVYRKLRVAAASASLVFCSHHQLAHHVRQMMFKSELTLPAKIDTLLVDEAHLLESAFSAVFSSTLHLRGFERFLKASTISGKKAALEAVEAFCSSIQLAVRRNGGDAVFGTSEELLWMGTPLKDFTAGLNALKPKKKSPEMRRINMTKLTIRDALSRFTSMRMEVTPVKQHPVFTTGKANLDAPLKMLWDSVGCAAVVSATLYTTGSSAGGLMRWKLGIPKERVEFLKPVIPAWVKAPVTLRIDDSLIQPDESEQWHQELADRILKIAGQAVGGTLVLATAYATVSAVQKIIYQKLGDRLMVQGPGASAGSLAAVFKARVDRPVWLGVGVAWTGIDLSNKELPAERDNTLSDLVICRLPMGSNRSLPHYRRVQVIGMSAVVQEAAWTLRQGVGRLVRRKGAAPKNLWVLDSRIASGDNWVSQFKGVLSGYSKAGLPWLR